MTPDPASRGPMTLTDRLDALLFVRMPDGDRRRELAAELAAGLEAHVPGAPPASPLLGEAFANRIAIRAGELLDDREPRVPELSRAELGRIVVEAAAEELGEVTLSTLVRSKIASTAAVIDRAGSTDALGQAARALVDLAQASNVLKLGESAEADHRAALRRAAELEAELEHVRGELADVVPMPAGSYWLDVQGRDDGDVADVAIVVGAEGRKVTAGNVTRDDLAIATREALSLATSAIADDLERRRQA